MPEAREESRADVSAHEKKGDEPLERADEYPLNRPLSDWFHHSSVEAIEEALNPGVTLWQLYGYTPSDLFLEKDLSIELIQQILTTFEANGYLFDHDIVWVEIRVAQTDMRDSDTVSLYLSFTNIGLARRISALTGITDVPDLTTQTSTMLLAACRKNIKSLSISDVLHIITVLAEHGRELQPDKGWEARARRDLPASRTRVLSVPPVPEPAPRPTPPPVPAKPKPVDKAVSVSAQDELSKDLKKALKEAGIDGLPDLHDMVVNHNYDPRYLGLSIEQLVDLRAAAEKAGLPIPPKPSSKQS